MKIFINAGHHLADRGAIHNGHFEARMAIDLVRRIASLIDGYEVLLVPDNLTLKESIAWVKERVESGDMAFSVHFNSHNKAYINGTEVYHSNDREKEMAIVFSEEVAKAGNFRNRGAKHDSQTWVGSLGWLRKLKCDSVLVEVCYLTSDHDMKLYNADSVAKGFVTAISKTQSTLKEIPSYEDLKKENAGYKQVVAQLIAFITSLINK